MRRFARLGSFGLPVFLMLASTAWAGGTPASLPDGAKHWIGLGDGVDWSDGDNWSPPGVPGADDDVFLRVEVPDTIESRLAPTLGIHVATRAVVRTLHVGSPSGLVTLTIVDDTLTASLGGDNQGVVVVGFGAALETPEGALFKNKPEGEVVLEGGNLAGAGTFVNEGLLRKTDPVPASRAASTISVEMENRQDDPADGAIRVEEGVAIFESPIGNSGEIIVHSGAEMLLDPADGPITAGDAVTNDGLVILEEGALLSFVDAAVFANRAPGELRLFGGDLGGDGLLDNLGLVAKLDPEGIPTTSTESDIAIAVDNRHDDPADGAITVSGGTLAIQDQVTNSGEIIVHSGAEMLLDPADGPITAGEIVTNDGLVILEEGATMTFVDASVFANLAPGELRLLGGDLLGDGLLDNLGLVAKLDPEGSPTTSTESDIAIAVDNRHDDPADGAITVGGGTLAIQDQLTNSGEIIVHSGSEMLLDPADGPFVVTEAINDGRITVDEDATLVVVDPGLVLKNRFGGVVELRGGDLLGGGRVDNVGEILKTEPTAFRSARSAIDLVVESRHDDPGDGAIIVQGGELALQDSLLSDGRVEVDSGGSLVVEAPAGFTTGGGVILSAGLVDVAAGGALVDRGAVSIALSGVVRVKGTAGIDPGATWFQRGRTYLEENGSLSVETDGRAAGTFENHGLLDLSDGAAVMNHGVFLHRENGVLSGTGVVDNGAGQFLAEGIFKPGRPVGDLNLIGDLDLQPVSEVWVQIGGTTPGAQYDRLIVDGNVMFDGALQVALLDFAPQTGDRFDVIQGASAKRRSSIGCYGGLDAPGGLFLEPVEETNALALVTVDSMTTNTAPVAAFDLAMTDTGVPVVISPLLNDVDDDGDPLRIVGLGTEGTVGYVEIDDRDSTVTYTPAGGFGGADVFTYIITDCMGGADSATVTVNVSRDPRAWLVPDDAPTIQAGVDSAFPGDTVIVARGTYVEHDIAMKSGVVLRGETGRAGSVVIDAGGSGRGILCDGVDPGTRIEAMTVAAGAAVDGAGLLCSNGAAPELHRVAFVGNAATMNGGGAAVDGTSHPVFRQCTFSGNHAGGVGGGLAVAKTALLDRAVVWGNDASSGDAVHAATGATVTFVDADVDTTELDGPGSFLFGGTTLSVDPMACGALPAGDAPTAAGDYRLDYDSPCFTTPETAIVGAYGVGCWGSIVIDEEWYGSGDFPDSVRTAVEDGAADASSRAFFRVFPNPARDGLTVAWARPSASEGRLAVYDVTGRMVRSYGLGGASGTFRWDGRSDAGRLVAPGVYFLRLEIGRSAETRRVTLIR